MKLNIYYIPIESIKLNDENLSPITEIIDCIRNENFTSLGTSSWLNILSSFEYYTNGFVEEYFQECFDINIDVFLVPCLIGSRKGGLCEGFAYFIDNYKVVASMLVDTLLILCHEVSHVILDIAIIRDKIVPDSLIESLADLIEYYLTKYLSLYGMIDSNSLHEDTANAIRLDSDISCNNLKSVMEAYINESNR